MAKEYSELVKRAESAVASVKDPELRRAAFEKILDDLLSSPVTGASPSGRRGPVQRNAKRAFSASRSTGPRAYICEMKDDRFFEKQKTIAEVKAELANRGHHIPLTSLSGPLQKLCQAKELRRQKGGEKKKTFVYSNW
ncbi:MAG: hypothetical protein ABIR71_11690 [Chthoniobacterales bacterium]